MQSSAQGVTKAKPIPGDWSPRDLGCVLLLTVWAFLVMGYHPGLEDDAFYLAAIKHNLNPGLFPHDADFFRVQFQATIFDKLIAFSVPVSHLPLAWGVLLWQLAAIFFVLHGCWRVSRRCFSEASAQWAAVALVAALLTLPVTGTGINLADQYLHPRTLAAAAILAAVVDALDHRYWRTGVLLAIAFAVHALMAAFAISFCAFLLWKQTLSLRDRTAETAIAAAALMPFGWIFEPASDAWRKAAATRSFYFLTQWEWYEWLGILGPLVILYLVNRRRDRLAENQSDLPILISSLIAYGLFQTVVGLTIMLAPGLERLRPLEPMRYLHLIYLFLFSIVGGFIGRSVLDRHVYRWLLLFLPLSVGMFYAQQQMYPSSRHLELPGLTPRNPWLQAFSWIRQNTPADALFALDPHYMTLPGEDYHGFRALAERSVLADYEKDGGMAARVPRLAPRWLKEVNAQTGWQNFQAADFQRLSRDFGVSWVVIAHSKTSDSLASDPAAFLTCPYQNQELRVCRLY
jgi:hypothetical protein